MNVTNLLIVDPSGELLFEDTEMKPIGAYRGRISDSKSRELLKFHAEYELHCLGTEVDIPVTNVALKTDLELEEIAARVKSGIYEWRAKLR